MTGINQFHGVEIMHYKLRIIQIAVAIVLTLIALLGLAYQSASAQSPAGVEQRFGIASLTEGQKLRVNVVNVGDSRLATRIIVSFDIYGLGGPDTAEGGICVPGAAVAACTNNLRPLRRETCTFVLGSGAAATCDLNSLEPNTFASTILSFDLENPSIVTTVELRENNRTVFMLPGLLRGFNPQPDPPSN